MIHVSIEMSCCFCGRDVRDVAEDITQDDDQRIPQACTVHDKGGRPIAYLALVCTYHLN